MTVSVPDTMTPGGDFPVARAKDISTSDGSTVEQTLTITARISNFQPRIVPGKNDADAGVVIAREVATGRVLIRAAPASVGPRVTSSEAAARALAIKVGDGPLLVKKYAPRIVPGKAVKQPLLRTPSGKVILGRTPDTGTDVAKINARISRTLDPNGMPLNPIYGEWFLRNTHARLQALAAGVVGMQVGVYLPGDSWEDNPNYVSRPFAAALRAGYGYAAIGWVGFRADTIDPNMWVTNSGTWTLVDETAASPDIYAVTSSTIGSQRVINAGNQAKIPTSAKLQWKGTADGVIRYRSGAGAWTMLNVQGAGIQHADLINVPVVAPWTMTFEVVSGSVDLRGVIFGGTANGVIVHKGGNSGSHTADWVGVDRAEFIASIAPLPMHIAIIPWGVNDQALPIGADDFGNNVAEFASRVRAAHPAADGLPECDILVSIPPELEPRLANGLSMIPYWRKILDIADANRFAVVGLPRIFGSDPANYRAMMDADRIHPLDLGNHLVGRSWLTALGAYRSL